MIILLVLAPFSLRAADPENRDPGSFVALSVSGRIRVELYHSASPLLEIETTGTSSENVLTENDGRELSIRLKTNTPKDARVKVKVFYTQLEDLEVQAHALITSPETIRGESMNFEGRSGGKMELNLDLTSLMAEVGQGAILVFSGKTEKQTIAASTGGTYSSFPLEALDTYVKATSGGKAKVVAQRTIDATASVKGYIGYRGEPGNKHEKTSLGGEIVHAGQ